MVTSTFLLREANKAITIRHLITPYPRFTYPPQVLGVGDVAEQYDEIGLLWGAADLTEFVDILSQIPLVAHPWELSTTALVSLFLGCNRKSYESEIERLSARKHI